VLDSDVIHTEGSIKAAEKITGGKFPNPTDFKEEIKVITPWVPPTLAQYPGVTMISSAAQL
jgi:hypothetical protein